MKLLLDTHALLWWWWWKDDPRLSKRAAAAIADEGATLVTDDAVMKGFRARCFW